MTTTKRKERIAELNEMMRELEMTQRETLFAILFDFYEAAGFADDPLSAELEAMSDVELMEAYLNI